MADKSKINAEDLGKFLIEAKRNTWASGKKAINAGCDGKYFIFAKGPYFYKDSHHEDDPNPFIGQEIVSADGMPIWGMNYYGKLTEEGKKYKDQKRLIDFLREALMANEDIKTPFRGPTGHLPSKMRIGTEDIAYTNKSIGTILRFKGIEAIREFIPPTDSYGKMLYQLEYHGGII